jgi:hypothetical protein
MSTTPIRPPFTRETALAKVQAAEDAWNSRDPGRVALAYTVDSEWRNRAEFLRGREEIRAFLVRKWQREQDYRLQKTLWVSTRIASPCASNTSGMTARASGPVAWQRWEFDDDGLMAHRYASINDAPIREDERRLLAPDHLAAPTGDRHDAPTSPACGGIRSRRLPASAAGATLTADGGRATASCRYGTEGVRPRDGTITAGLGGTLVPAASHSSTGCRGTVRTHWHWEGGGGR